ncbi:MAG: hypothetical protein H0W08_19755 [Acidobacteria bacterium]|nr:hypothetical protein [Acidobacteriota bacterium]
MTSPGAGTDALPGVSSLFRDLARDVWHLPSWETAVVLGAAGGASFGMRNQDRTITTRLASSPMFDRVFESGEVLGGGLVLVGAAVATYTAGRVMQDPRVATVGSDLVRAQILSAVLTHSVKRRDTFTPRRP